MISTELLYVAVVILAVLLVNTWVVLGRYVHQIKMPPSEQDYEQLTQERQKLLKELESKDAEITELQGQIHDLTQKAPEPAPAPQ